MYESTTRNITSYHQGKSLHITKNVSPLAVQSLQVSLQRVCAYPIRYPMIHSWITPYNMPSFIFFLYLSISRKSFFLKRWHPRAILHPDMTFAGYSNFRFDHDKPVLFRQALVYVIAFGCGINKLTMQLKWALLTEYLSVCQIVPLLFNRLTQLSNTCSRLVL